MNAPPTRLHPPGTQFNDTVHRNTAHTNSPHTNTEHFIVACRASALVLGRQGHLEDARALQNAADAARNRLQAQEMASPAGPCTGGWRGWLP